MPYKEHCTPGRVDSRVIFTGYAFGRDSSSSALTPSGSLAFGRQTFDRPCWTRWVSAIA